MKPGIQFTTCSTANLGAGTLDHVVNDTGDVATTAAVGTPVTSSRRRSGVGGLRDRAVRPLSGDRGASVETEPR